MNCLFNSGARLLFGAEQVIRQDWPSLLEGSDLVQHLLVFNISTHCFILYFLKKFRVEKWFFVQKSISPQLINRSLFPHQMQPGTYSYKFTEDFPFGSFLISLSRLNANPLFALPYPCSTISATIL